MNKASLLEGSVCISQLESRLYRNSYLSQESLPSGVDGLIFLFIDKQKSNIAFIKRYRIEEIILIFITGSSS